MPKRLYLDSNVFISFVREEIDSAFNLRYLESRNFFAFCAKQGHVLIISELFLSEIEKVIGLDRKAVFEEFGRTRVETIFIHEKIDRQLVSKIIKETGLHRTDAVHVSIAFGNKINFIVTWNIRDFEKALVFVKCVSPNGFLDTL